MVLEDGNQSLVFGHKLSSVGPGHISGNNRVYEPNNIDLALKLHYLKIIYFIDNQAMEGITLRNMKEFVFTLFNYYYESCGRFRRFENGRPYIKCNDCGARFMEAISEKTLEEWLRMEGDVSVQKQLLPHHHVLGPQLTYSPPLFLQITFFKCGGISLGLSWAHVLGDVFSATNFMNSLAQLMNGQKPNHPPFLKASPPPFPNPVKAVTSIPHSIKDVGPLGDLWTATAPCEMDTYSFHVTRTRLSQLQAKLSDPNLIRPFEALCGVIWQAIAKVIIGPKPNVVTILKKDDAYPIEDKMVLRNNQVVCYVKADFPVEKAHPKDLATLIRDWAEDERAEIGDMVGRDPGGSDFIVYGSKLSFVNMEEACFYGFEVKGISPRLVSCFVDGVGEGGVVLVLPCPQSGYKGGRDDGRIVTLTLPKSYMAELKEELNKEWDLFAY